MLVEVTRADASFHGSEREAVLDALRARFELADDEAQGLSELAEATASGATNLFSFTSRINERFEMAEKLRMIEQIWHVACVDGRLSGHERHVLWCTANLLHVSQGAYMHARLRAQQPLPGPA